MSKKKYYLTLDTETATLPFADEICSSPKQKLKVSIAKPLVYDIGWVITDRSGTILKKENFLIQETFFVPNVFNTAYYREKRPVYMELLSCGEICVKTWNDAIEILLEDLRQVDITAAYNASFDFKKAIPFTEQYISHLYSSDFNEWERKQRYSSENIVKGAAKDGTNPDFLKPIFELRGESFPIVDLWALACERLINIDKYRDYCLKNALLTASAQYFRTNAETTYQYLMKEYDFIEEHTALSDAIIEAAILTKVLNRKGKAVKPDMSAFPFRKLGTTVDYVTDKKTKYAKVVTNAMRVYLESNFEISDNYYNKIMNMIAAIEEAVKEDK